MKRLAILVPLLLACGPFFYQAPPSLDHYPERTPTKGYLEILDSAHPLNPESHADLTADLRVFCHGITSLSKGPQLEKIDEFLARNRQGHFDIPLANFLLELRELVELETPYAELQPYLEWRSFRLPPPSPPAVFVRKWNASQDEVNQAKLAFVQKHFSFLSSHDERIEAASPELKPYEITQRASMYLAAGFPELALFDFESVIKKFPDHPRSEVARFMLARIALQHSRTIPRNNFQDEKDFNTAHDQALETTRGLFKQYLEKYPHGRFANDCFGWLGGIARDQENLAAAVEYQIKRLASRSTREVTSSVLRECDQIFTSLFLKSSAKDFRWDGFHAGQNIYESLASQPLVARLFVAHAIDPAAQIHLPIYQENFSGDRGTIQFLKKRIIAPGPFTRQSLHHLGAAIIKNGKPSDPTSLLILGWSSARSGDHDQALSLFELGLKLDVTDELLHAKAVALSRLDKDSEAARTYQELFDKFPESPLVDPSRFDLAMAHLNSGQAGLALTIFLQLESERQLVIRARQRGELRDGQPQLDPLYLHPEFEALQWIDTIVQFSPLEELERGFKDLAPGHPTRPLFRRALSLRGLCEERFEFARAFIIPEPTEVPPIPKRWQPQSYFDLTSDRWDRDVAPLIADHQKLTDPNLTSEEQAQRHLQIARHWQSRRGQLTLPLHHLTGAARSEQDLLDRLRRDNALARGLSRPAIDQVLTSRDELTHALKHFLAAAELSQNPNLAAPALEGANEALFRLAELTPYRASLASRNGHSELSLKLVDRLRSEFPNRPEALRALPFTFLPPLLRGNWLPGDRITWIADLKIAEVFSKPDQAAEAKASEITQTLSKLSNGDATLPEIQAALAQLASDFRTLRPKLKPTTLITLADHLDDLQLVARHPGITAPLFRQYLPIRLSQFAPPLTPQPAQPLSPFLDFLHQARTPKLKATWADYLTRHPKSPKSEAISLRQTRSQIRKSFPIPHVRPVFFPDAPRSEGYKRLAFPSPTADSIDGSKLLAAHRQQFPNGNYQSDLDLLEAALAAAEKDYPRALGLLAKILKDPQHPELYQNASLQFSELALRLLDLKERPNLVPAFKNDPAALAILEKLVQSKTCLARLRPLLPLK